MNRDLTIPPGTPAESIAWLNKFTTTTAADQRCTNFDLAMNNCDFKTGIRVLRYDSTKNDYLQNWDAIVDAGGETAKATTTAATVPLVSSTGTTFSAPSGTATPFAPPLHPRNLETGLAVSWINIL